MKLATLLFAAPFALEFCRAEPDRAPLPDPKPPALIPAAQMGTVLRVNMQKRLRGTAVVVNEHHLATTSMILEGYAHEKNLVTVGPERLSATVIAVDEVAGLAVIRTPHSLPQATVFAPIADDLRDAMMVGYMEVATLDNIELLQFSAHVSNVNSNVETTGVVDTRGALELRAGRNTIGFWRGGAAVLEPGTGRFLGVVVGSHHVDDLMAGPFYAIPSTKVMAFLDKHGIDYTRSP
jgi:hypothetical protein